MLNFDFDNKTLNRQGPPSGWLGGGKKVFLQVLHPLAGMCIQRLSGWHLLPKRQPISRCDHNTKSSVKLFAALETSNKEQIWLYSVLVRWGNLMFNNNSCDDSLFPNAAPVTVCLFRFYTAGTPTGHIESSHLDFFLWRRPRKRRLA